MEEAEFLRKKVVLTFEKYLQTALKSFSQQNALYYCTAFKLSIVGGKGIFTAHRVNSLSPHSK